MFKCGTVKLFLFSFKQEIVLTQPNPEITHTLELFLGSFKLFICAFELLAAAFCTMSVLALVHGLGTSLTALLLDIFLLGVLYPLPLRIA